MTEIFFESDLAAGSVVADNGRLYEVMSFNKKSDRYICRELTDGKWLEQMKQKYPNSKLSIPQDFKAWFQAGQWIED